MRRQSKFANLGEAARFYGMGRAQFMEMRKLGLASKDPMPIDSPAKMPTWFDRQQVKGKRKRKCPGSILARAAEAGVGKKKPLPTPEAQAPLKMGGEATNEDIFTRERQLYAAFDDRYLKHVIAGTENSPEGQLAARGREKSMERLLEWTKNFKHFTESGDYMRTAEVKAAGAEFASGLLVILRREFLEQFTPGDHQKVAAVMDRVADKMPQVMTAYFAT